MERHVVQLSRHAYLQQWKFVTWAPAFLFSLLNPSLSVYRKCTLLTNLTRKFKEDGHPMIYLDETWISENHSANSSCLQNEDWGGMCVPAGKGRRLVVLHAGSDSGFVPNCLQLFCSSTGLVDGQKDVDSEVFTTWFRDKVLQNVPPNSVIVMDNASPHCVPVDKIPTSGSPKSAMLEWLYGNGVTSVAPTMLKVELYELIRQNRPKSIRYVIDEMARSYGHTVLRIPPYHCEYNPIGQIWAEVKHNIGAKNKTCKMEDVQGLAMQEILAVGTESWKSCVRRVDEICQRAIAECGTVEENVEQLIVQLGGDDKKAVTSSDDSDENSD